MPVIESAEEKAKQLYQLKQFKQLLDLLMESYGDELFRFILSILQEQELANDTLQNVFVKAYTGLPNFKGKSTYRTWIYVICRNHCIDIIRKKSRDVIPTGHSKFEDETADVNNVPDQSFLKDHLLEKILSYCLEKLSFDIREAILLRYQQGYTLDEIANHQQAKADTIQARISRSLPKLKQCLSDNGAIEDRQTDGPVSILNTNTANDQTEIQMFEDVNQDTYEVTPDDY